MQIPYKEIVLPNLVKDVQEIFWDHINPYGFPKESRMLRALRIDEYNSNHTKMIEIVNRYPFLDYHLLIFILTAGKSTLIHLDGMGEKYNRGCSCNIPVSGCTSSGVTEFFDLKDDDFYIDPVRTTRFIKPGVTGNKIYEYALKDNPMLCNTQLPHRVTNQHSSETRISVSWTIKPFWTWDKIFNYIESIRQT